MADAPDYIFDNHLHLDPNGGNIESIRRFEKAGGTHCVISHMPYRDRQVAKGATYKEQYQVTVDLAERVLRETGVKAYVAVGPYPVDMIYLEKVMGLDRAKNVMLDGIDLAARFVDEKDAVAIGEIGRPHFKVSNEIIKACNEVLEYAMKRAKDLRCPVILHTETPTPKLFKEMAEMADRIGLPREKVVKHYSPAYVLESENHGLFPSVLARRESVIEALKKGDRFVLETDFLDDPSRPGAVLDIDTVPNLVNEFLEGGQMTSEQAHKLGKDNPEKIYGISLDKRLIF